MHGREVSLQLAVSVNGREVYRAAGAEKSFQAGDTLNKRFLQLMFVSMFVYATILSHPNHLHVLPLKIVILVLNDLTSSVNI